MITTGTFITFGIYTVIIVSVEGFIYGDLKRAIKLIPLAMLFSGILTFVFQAL